MPYPYDDYSGIPSGAILVYGWPDGGIPGGYNHFSAPAEQWGGVPRRGILTCGVPMYGILQRLSAAEREDSAGMVGRRILRADLIGRDDEDIFEILSLVARIL